MASLGLKPGASGWKAQTNPLSYGGTPKLCLPYEIEFRRNLVWSKKKIDFIESDWQEATECV